jgi:hypothetical protein
VWLEINNTNITATSLSGNIFNATYDFDYPGNYIYNWHAYGNGTNNLYNYSKQSNLLKNAILEKKKLMLESCRKNEINYEKFDFLQRKFKRFKNLQDYSSVDLALFKEKFFIDGMRAMKNKVGGLDKKLDLKIINLFKLNPNDLKNYLRSDIEFENLKDA